MCREPVLPPWQGAARVLHRGRVTGATERFDCRRIHPAQKQIKQLFTFRHSLGETATGYGGVKSLALELQQRFLMSRVQHELLPVVAAPVPRNLHQAIEYPHFGGRSGES